MQHDCQELSTHLWLAGYEGLEKNMETTRFNIGDDTGTPIWKDPPLDSLLDRGKST